MASTATQVQAQDTVAGFFDSEQGAQRAMQELLQAGFQRDQIGMALSSGTGTGAALESGDRGDVRDAREDGANDAGATRHTGEGMWAKVKEFFTGNEAEPYAGEREPGSSDTREITDDSVYDDAGYADASHDAVHHSLSGMSVAADRASYFGGRFGRGDEGAVVTVSAGNRRGEAETILERNGADLGEGETRGLDNGASAGAAFAGTRDNAVNRATDQGVSGTTPVGGVTTPEGQQNIRLYGEVLRVHKDRISRGEVHLRKEVVTETQTIQVPVTREELVIERVAGSGEAVPAGTDAFSGQEIRIPLTEERASVEKQAVLEEEIRVGKRAVGSTENFNETVRHEKLDVEDGTAGSRADLGSSADKL